MYQTKRSYIYIDKSIQKEGMYMAKYKSGEMRFSELLNSVVLPSFQRRLVWSKTQKEGFIKTLSNGYPFGSILVYKYKDTDEQDKFTLIDGLQRYTTIVDFQNSPEKYMNFEDQIEKLYNIFSRDQEDTITVSVEKKIKSTIEKKIKEVIKERGNGGTDWQWSLADKLKDDTLSGYYDGSDQNTLRNVTTIQHDIMKEIDNYIDTKNIIIPFIEFIGDPDELATVFENLNLGGKKLSKYQVFAAQWSNNEITLNNLPFNTKLLDNVIFRYESLIDERDIDIENFDAIKMKDSKNINLAELCGALGELILESAPVFWDDKNAQKEDKANSIGYSTVAITLGISNKKLNEISKMSSVFENNLILEDYVEKVIKEYKELNNYFERYLRHPGVSDKKKFENSSIADFQILSFFASLWTLKYTFNEDKKSFEYISKYKNIYQSTKNNFIYYLLDDVVSKRWSGTGDSKLDQFYIENNNRYIKTIDKDSLNESLKKWWDERSQSGSIRFEPVSKLILTVQTSFFLPHYKAPSYDFEHVINKASVEKIYKQDDIPAGSLGNMMFLDSKYNRSKKNTNLYEVLQEGHRLDDEYLSNTLYPTEPDLSSAMVGLQKKKIDSTKTKEVIINRGNHIINNLISNLYK